VAFFGLALSNAEFWYREALAKDMGLKSFEFGKEGVDRFALVYKRHPPISELRKLRQVRCFGLSSKTTD